MAQEPIYCAYVSKDYTTRGHVFLLGDIGAMGSKAGVQGYVNHANTYASPLGGEWAMRLATAADLEGHRKLGLALIR